MVVTTQTPQDLLPEDAGLFQTAPDFYEAIVALTTPSSPAENTTDETSTRARLS